MKVFGDKLKQLRIMNSYTLNYVAEYLNVSQTAYHYYESGEHEPTLTNLCKLADLYSVSVDELLGRPKPEFIAKETVDQIQNNLLESLKLLVKL